MAVSFRPGRARKRADLLILTGKSPRKTVTRQNRHTSANTLNSRGKPSKPSKGSAKLCKANLRPAIGLQHDSMQQTSLIDSKVLSNRSEIGQPRSCTVFCSYAIMAYYGYSGSRLQYECNM